MRSHRDRDKDATKTSKTHPGVKTTPVEKNSTFSVFGAQESQRITKISTKPQVRPKRRKITFWRKNHILGNFKFVFFNFRFFRFFAFYQKILFFFQFELENLPEVWTLLLPTSAISE